MQRRLESYKAERIFLQIQIKAAPLVTAQYHTILLDTDTFANTECAWIAQAFFSDMSVPHMTRER